MIPCLKPERSSPTPTWAPLAGVFPDDPVPSSYNVIFFIKYLMDFPMTNVNLDVSTAILQLFPASTRNLCSNRSNLKSWGRPGRNLKLLHHQRYNRVRPQRKAVEIEHQWQVHLELRGTILPSTLIWSRIWGPESVWDCPLTEFYWSMKNNRWLEIHIFVSHKNFREINGFV